MRALIVGGIAVTAALAIAVALIGGWLGGTSDGSASAAGTVSAEIAISKTTFAQGEPIEVTFKLRNVGLDPITVVQPFDSPYLVFFEVIGPGGTLPFSGPWPRLPPFSQGDFVDLFMGESTANSFDLTQSYDLTDVGSYAITAVYRNFDDGARFGLTAVTTDEIFSNSIVIQVEAAP